MKAGGAVLASIGTGYVLSKWGSSLPLATNQYGKLVYTMGIPILGAFLIHRKSRDLAEGMVIGGLVMSINSLMSSFNLSGVAAPATAATGRFAVAGELGRPGQPFGYYPRTMADRSALGGSNVAFPVSAW
jgi:predicted permease